MDHKDTNSFPAVELKEFKLRVFGAQEPETPDLALISILLDKEFLLT